MGGVPHFLKRENSGSCQKLLDIERKAEIRLVGDLKGKGELNPTEVLVICKMINKALELPFLIKIPTLQGQKDVASFPIPVELIQIWIEGMTGAELGRRCVIEFLGTPTEKRTTW